MAFDDDLTRAFDALSDRLHAEVQHQIEAAMAELRAAAPPPAPVAPPPALELPPPPVAAADYTPLVGALRAMDAARSLTDILDALTTAAAAESRGAAIRLHHGGRTETWRAIGVVGSGVGSGDAHDATHWPLTISGEAIGELYAEGGSADALEILARHASRCLESMTAFKTARALAKQADGPTDEQLGEEDATARRYAKLLVSEIKLYHESVVIAGRRDRDLVARLGGEISRARVLYEQRVPPHVRQRADYFHDELVRTLADGDPTLLEFQA
jgi:hypothetical protein